MHVYIYFIFFTILHGWYGYGHNKNQETMLHRQCWSVWKHWKIFCRIFFWLMNQNHGHFAYCSSGFPKLQMDVRIKITRDSNIRWFFRFEAFKELNTFAQVVIFQNPNNFQKKNVATWVCFQAMTQTDESLIEIASHAAMENSSYRCLSVRRRNVWKTSWLIESHTLLETNMSTPKMVEKMTLLLHGLFKTKMKKSWCSLLLAAGWAEGKLLRKLVFSIGSPLLSESFESTKSIEIWWIRHVFSCFVMKKAPRDVFFICDFFGMLDFRVVDSQICGFFSPGGDMMRYFHESL